MDPRSSTCLVGDKSMRETLLKAHGANEYVAMITDAEGEWATIGLASVPVVNRTFPLSGSIPDSPANLLTGGKYVTGLLR